MARAEILDDGNKVVNTIEADLAFLQANYPGRFRVVATPVIAPAPALLTIEEFRDRFQPAEKAAIHADGLTNGAMAAFLGDLAAKPPGVPCINIGSQKMAGAMSFIVQRGHVTQARATVILTP